MVDRLVIKDDLGNRLADSLEVALGLTDGIAVAEMADAKAEDEDPERLVFQRALPAPYPASRLTRLNRACFRSTIPSAPVRHVTGWARSFLSIR